MNIVRELRKKKGVQQKEIALAVGVAQPTVSEWELGKKDPSGERLRKLSEYFGVDELVILGKGVVDLKETVDSIPEGTKINVLTNEDRVVQRILDKLNAVEDPPKTPEIKIVSGMMEKMTKDQQEQVVAVIRAMFANHPEILE